MIFSLLLKCLKTFELLCLAFYTCKSLSSNRSKTLSTVVIKIPSKPQHSNPGYNKVEYLKRSNTCKVQLYTRARFKYYHTCIALTE